jgi:hypothetical protein
MAALSTVASSWKTTPTAQHLAVESLRAPQLGQTDKLCRLVLGRSQDEHAATAVTDGHTGLVLQLSHQFGKHLRTGATQLEQGTARCLPAGHRQHTGGSAGGLAPGGTALEHSDPQGSGL